MYQSLQSNKMIYLNIFTAVCKSFQAKTEKPTTFKLKPLSKASVRPLKNIPIDEEKGLLLPTCAKLLHSNHLRSRMEHCCDIYILCSEFNYDVSVRDVRALFTALFRLKCDTERYVVRFRLLACIGGFRLVFHTATLCTKICFVTLNF